MYGIIWRIIVIPAAALTIYYNVFFRFYFKRAPADKFLATYKVVLELGNKAEGMTANALSPMLKGAWFRPQLLMFPSGSFLEACM